jgi:hypothetical protein
VDTDGTIAAHEWREGNCTTGTLLSSASSFSLATPASGIRTIFYRVRDNSDAWSTNCPSRVVTVNTAPIPIPPPSAPAVTSTSTKFSLNDRVIANANVNVRSSSNIGASILGTQPNGSQGTIVGGPMLQGGFHWWNVNYDSGVDGWSAQDFLTKVVVPTSLPTPPPPAPAPTPTSTANTKFPSWMSWGAFVGWQPTRMDEFVALVGKQPQMEAIFSHWGNDTFPFQYATRIRDQGRTMVIFWEALDYNRPYFSQPEYGFDAVNNGSLDAFFTKYARDAKAYAGPIILIPYSEFNGNWYPWGMTVGSNTPTKFIEAWKRIHDIFVREGATNVKFAWVPNNDSVPDVPANNFDLNWPGSQYVDYVGLDGFNSAKSWETFDKMMNTEILRLKKYEKPIYIFSMAAAEHPQKAAWITDAFTVQLYKHPEVKGWIWFNENKEEDWRVNSSPASLEAFKAMLPD